MVGIKGIEMPRNCLDCPMRNYRDDEGNRCDLTGLHNRDDCCPLTEIITCKDCKHWKDSDGVYRRGIGAESKCPINTKEVFEGNFYCKLGERRE